MLLLAGTTPLEEVKKPTEGLSLFYTALIVSQRLEARVIDKMGRKAVEFTSCSSMACRCRWRIASARKAACVVFQQHFRHGA